MLNAEENFGNDYQLVLDKLSQMIYESKPITMEERGEIVHVLNDQRIRESVTEILQDIKAPKRIHNLDCLKLLSDVIRFLLTLFVHEQQIDYELLSAILDSSQFLHFLQNNRKIYLTNYIVDHGIWSNNIRAWKECIERNVAMKMQESAERIRRR